MNQLTVGWLSDGGVQAVMSALNAYRPNCARFVGGCVRNALMGREVDDIDIATQLQPEETQKALAAADIRAIPTGIEHGTITAVIDGQPFEITSLRKDVETDGRRAVIAFTEDWDEDAQRRDFRLNAIYADADGKLYDPTGGLEDTKTGLIIFIGNPDDRLREDYLRILRFFRFNAWYGREMDLAGLAACERQKQGLEQISAERIWKELKKLLSAEDPRAVVAAMNKTAVLEMIFPGIALNFKRFSNLVETELNYFLPVDPFLRLASLLPKDLDVATDLATRLRFSNGEKRRLEDWAADETRIVSYLSAREVRRALYRIGTTTYRDRVRLCWAEERNLSTTPQWRALIAMSEGYERPVLPVGGEDVLKAGAQKGPLVGKILKEVEDWWVDADFIDDKFSAIERLKAVVQAMVY